MNIVMSNGTRMSLVEDLFIKVRGHGWVKEVAEGNLAANEVQSAALVLETVGMAMTRARTRRERTERPVKTVRFALEEEGEEASNPEAVVRIGRKPTVKMPGNPLSFSSFSSSYSSSSLPRHWYDPPPQFPRIRLQHAVNAHDMALGPGRTGCTSPRLHVASQAP